MSKDRHFIEIDERNCLINSHQSFSGYALTQIRDFFKYETTWSSNALEGNSIDLSETEIILKDKMTVHGHSLREIHECTGHGDAYDYMFSLIAAKTITEENIKQCQKLFAQHIPEIPLPGEYRDKSRINVFLTGSKNPLPEFSAIPSLMEQYASWLFSNRGKMHPVEFAAQAHQQLLYIHPFPDGNGRVSRLVMNTILLQERYLPVSIPLIRKSEYCNLLEHGTKNSKPFVQFIAELELMTEVHYMRMMHIPYAVYSN